MQNNANTTQFLAIFENARNFTQDSRKPTQIPASSSRTEELPSPTRKPFGELDLGA